MYIKITFIIPEMNIIDASSLIWHHGRFFIEKDSWPYQGIIYLWRMLHSINNYYSILYLLLAIKFFFYFQINDAY